MNARNHGFSLVELMVALTIGSLILVGTVAVYSQSRSSYAVNETNARLQEEARYVLSIIEPDVQLAGLYGYVNSADRVSYVNGGNTIANSDMQQADPTVPGFLPASAACGRNFAIDLMATIQGSNDGFLLGPDAVAPGPGSGCAERTPVATADTLTIRRVSTQAVAPAANRVQFWATRLRSSEQLIVSDGVLPAAVVADMQELRDLVVRTYYVADRADGREAGYPALRVIALGNGHAFEDTELMPGVEDLQVQFGIDTGDHDGIPGIDFDPNGDGVPDAPLGIATRYVNPDSALLPGAQVVAVRLWLRLRAEQPETGFEDGNTYTYAGKDYTPAGVARTYRRVLVTRTITLRNSRTL